MNGFLKGGLPPTIASEWCMRQFLFMNGDPTLYLLLKNSQKKIMDNGKILDGHT